MNSQSLVEIMRQQRTRPLNLLGRDISELTEDQLDVLLEEIRLVMLGHVLFQGVVRARAEVFDYDWR